MIQSVRQSVGRGEEEEEEEEEMLALWCIDVFECGRLCGIDVFVH